MLYAISHNLWYFSVEKFVILVATLNVFVLEFLEHRNTEVSKIFLLGTLNSPLPKWLQNN